MENFVLSNNVYITYAIEFIAVLAGVFTYKKYKQSAAIFFIHILFFIFFLELFGSYPNYYGKVNFLKPLYDSVFRDNYWWFTICFDVITIFLFSRLFYKVLKRKTYKKIVSISSYTFIIVSIVYIFLNFNKLFFQFFIFIQILGAVLIIISTVSYFLEIINNDKILTFYKDLYFYVAVAIFMWWIIVTPVSFFDIYFRAEDWNFILLKWQIYLIANMFMYITFAIGLIVSKTEKIND